MFSSLETALDFVAMPAMDQQTIFDVYAQEHRHYHNLSHIESIVKLIPTDRYYTKVLIEASVFHDFVYLEGPQPLGLNESLSVAEYALYTLKSFFGNQTPSPYAQDPESMEHERLVIEAINATAYHLMDQDNLSESTKLFLDFDLKILASPWEEFIAYDAAIEKELGGNLDGRDEFLRTLLNRKSLFYMHPEWDVLARKNLMRKRSQS